MAASGIPVNDATDDELRALFGRRSDYYIERWRGTGHPRTNLAALFLTGFWMSFRRMPLAAAFFALTMAVTQIIATFLVSRLELVGSPSDLLQIANLPIAVVFGVFGNRWYLAHTRRVLTRIRSRRLPLEEHLRELRRRGGTRILSAIGWFVLLTVLLAVLRPFVQ